MRGAGTVFRSTALEKFREEGAVIGFTMLIPALRLELFWVRVEGVQLGDYCNTWKEIQVM